MPHILIDAFHSEMAIKHINVHVQIDFQKDDNKGRVQRKLDHLQYQFEEVVKSYFDSIASDQYTDEIWEEIKKEAAQVNEIVDNHLKTINH